VTGARRDFVWPERRIVVEIDGWRFHRTVQAADRDAQRGNDATLAGWLHLRFSRRRVVLRSTEVQRDLERAFRIGSRAP
jgi:very-short-patch-repair endonuclease